MELKDFINSANIALYMKQLPEEESLEKTLFPPKKILGTKLEQAKGAKKKPIALRQSTFDVNTKMRSLSANIKVTSTEIPFFKEACGIDETTRRELISAIGSNNQNLVDAVLEQVFEGYVNLVKGSEIIPKAMAAQVIQNGVINYSSDLGDGDVVVDYSVPANHKIVLTSTDKWDNPASDIVGDIRKYQKMMVKENYPKPTTLLMTEATFDKTFLINTAITNHLNGNVMNQNRILSQADYLRFAKEVLGVTIVFLEDATYYPYEGSEAVQYYEDNKVTFMSGTQLGFTYFGTSPEEFDKLHGTGKLDTTLTGPVNGTAITTMVHEDPISVDTKVSIMPIVSFDRADEVLFLTVC